MGEYAGIAETAERIGTTARLERERHLYAQALAEMTVRYEQKIREMSLLRRACDAMRDCTDVEDVLRRLLSIVIEELGTTACSLYLAEDTGDLLLRARSSRSGSVETFHPGQPGNIRVPPGVGPLGQTFTGNEVLVMAAAPEHSPGWFPAGAPVLVTAPLGPTTGCIGVLALHEAQEEDLPEDTPKLLPILATQATITIENALLYQRLKKHSDTLEIRVRERTAALEHLNAELQAAARQKSQFFAHFSHELRTPLNSILGFSEMLQSRVQGPLNQRQEQYIRHVRDSGKRLLNLINDILDLAKVEAGKLSLHLQPVSLRLAAQEAAAIMVPQASAKHLHLEHLVPSDLPRVMADPTRVHQILLNLLSNAVKFTPEGGTITISARRSGPSPNFVEVAIQDSGIGIAPEDQARLFRDFFQVASKEGKHQGTGLGLSLSRRLVELHGGKIWLTSAPGQGSRFSFTLPDEGDLAEPPGQDASGAGPERRP
jgi:signal transduction histidine kinase